MSTRIYLPSSGAAALSPAFAAEWYDTSSADRVAATWTPIGTAFATKNVIGPGLPAWSGSPVGYKILVRQYVTPAFTGTSTVLAGSGAGVFRAGASYTGGGAGAYAPQLRSCLVGVRVFTGGGSLKGVLSPPTNVPTGHSVFASLPSLVRRTWGVLGGGSPIAIATGDRLVLEFGYVITQGDATAITSYSASMEFGDASSSLLTYGDAAIDDGQKTPWVGISLSGGSTGGFTGAQIL